MDQWNLTVSMCKQESDLSIVAGSFRVSLVIGSGIHGIWGLCLGTFMISRPTLGYIHWWGFVYTECRHDVIVTLHLSNRPVCCIFTT